MTRNQPLTSKEEEKQQHQKQQTIQHVLWMRAECNYYSLTFVNSKVITLNAQTNQCSSSSPTAPHLITRSLSQPVRVSWNIFIEFIIFLCISLQCPTISNSELDYSSAMCLTSDWMERQAGREREMQLQWLLTNALLYLRSGNYHLNVQCFAINSLCLVRVPLNWMDC